MYTVSCAVRSQVGEWLHGRGECVCLLAQQLLGASHPTSQQPPDPHRPPCEKGILQAVDREAGSDASCFAHPAAFLAAGVLTPSPKGSYKKATVRIFYWQHPFYSLIYSFHSHAPGRLRPRTGGTDGRRRRSTTLNGRSPHHHLPGAPSVNPSHGTRLGSL